ARLSTFADKLEQCLFPNCWILVCDQIMNENVIINDNDEDLIKLQELMTGCLSYIHNFCEENKIRYFLLGGTLIGAIRHQGPIPWDDDADIGMPRPDYDRFVKLSDKVKAPYAVVHIGNNPSQMTFFAKFVNTKTKIMTHVNSYEITDENPIHGVWVDVFPIDGAFKNRLARVIHLKSIKVFKRLWSYRHGGLGLPGDGLYKTAKYVKVGLAYVCMLIPRAVFISI